MFGIIGGTGFGQFDSVKAIDQIWETTPFGESSGPITIAKYNGLEVAFLARHGNPHKIPPHLINYRANLYALKEVGVQRIIAVNAVGGIHSKLGPGKLAVPDQIIDYTYGREHSIYDGVYIEAVDHVDFTKPYTEALRQELIEAATSCSTDVLDGGVYGATQGPRLESSAEIERCKRDGCDMVGMTGMPEAGLARELGVEYACLALSANWAAGLSGEIITMDQIRNAISTASKDAERVLVQLMKGCSD